MADETPPKHTTGADETPPSPNYEPPSKNRKTYADLHKRSLYRVMKELFRDKPNLKDKDCVGVVGTPENVQINAADDSSTSSNVKVSDCVTSHNIIRSGLSVSSDINFSDSDRLPNENVASVKDAFHSSDDVSQSYSSNTSSGSFPGMTKDHNLDESRYLFPHYKPIHYSDSYLPGGLIDTENMSFSELLTLIDDPSLDNAVDIFSLMEWADVNYFLSDEFDPKILFPEDICNPSEGSSDSRLDRILKQFDESDDESTDDDCEARETLTDKVTSVIKFWTLEETVEFAKVQRLLGRLRTIPELSELPATTRRLVGTKTSKIRPTNLPSGGKYIHFGLRKCLEVILKGQKGTHLELLVNTDGLSLFKSKNSELWPILGRIRNLKSVSHIVFPIGFFFDYCQPKTPDYLNQFVDEIEDLIENGLKVGEEVFTISVTGVICDAPAKAIALGIMACNGKGSCTRCHVFGQWSPSSHRTYFDVDNARPRTHEEFLQQSDERYHHFTTPLVRIKSLKFCRSIVIDFMHLVLLGVSRTLIYLWMLGKRPHRMGAAGRREAIFHSTLLASFAPKEFCRKPRSYAEVSYFKASEWRQVLLYSGMVTFNYKRISPSKYQHFLDLVVATRIIVDPKMTSNQEWVSFARSLLHQFVMKFRSEYNEDFITHNLHNLLHICDDIEVFKNIEDVTAFPFENFMQFLIRLVRKAKDPLIQLYNRLEEFYKHGLLFQQVARKYFEEPDYSDSHTAGPLVGNVRDPQFRSMKLKFFEVTSNEKDNCCTIKTNSKEQVIVVKNFCMGKESNQMMVVGHYFVSQDDYFTSPCNSSLLGILKVSNLSSTLKAWPVSDILYKNYLIPATKHSSVAVPLLNTDFSIVY